MNDLKQCRANKLNQTFTGYEYPVSGIQTASRLPVAVFNTLSQPVTGTDLSRDEIYAVVARWDAMKTLADLYCRPALHEEFLNGPLPYVPPAVDGSIPDSLNEQDFHIDQYSLSFHQLELQDAFYRRFYQAATALWMLSEVIQLANIIQYSTVAEYNTVRQSLKTMLDSLNVKELFALREVENFLYSFLVPKIFAPYATSWSKLRDYVAGELSDRTNFANTWKRTMKTLRLTLTPRAIHQLLCFYADEEPLPANMSSILRDECAFGLRESNLITRITNVGGLRPKQRLGAMDFDAKDLERCVAGALRAMPAYERMSKSVLSAGWRGFITNTGFESWEDKVHGQLGELDEDWEDYRLAGLHAHIMPFHEKELAAKEERKRARRAKIDAARAAEIAANADEMDID